MNYLLCIGYELVIERQNVLSYTHLKKILCFFSHTIYGLHSSTAIVCILYLSKKNKKSFSPFLGYSDLLYLAAVIILKNIYKTFEWVVIILLNDTDVGIYRYCADFSHATSDTLDSTDLN